MLCNKSNILIIIAVSSYNGHLCLSLQTRRYLRLEEGSRQIKQEVRSQ